MLTEYMILGIGYSNTNLNARLVGESKLSPGL
jgi:hypothetical protein